MNYRQTLEYLYSRLPMFTRIGEAAFKKDLTNALALCSALGDPQRTFRSVHIGGTNGKGSTSHMLAAILQSAGYKTGLYTSPHLKDFRERIRVNGKMIGKEEVRVFVEKHRQLIEEIAPSFFEATVAMAFDHFASHKVDVAVIEVGLGGRIDSTNVITPLLSVITNISYDHKNLLGNSLQEIAAEKAGIIKERVPVIIGQRQEETAQVFIRKAAAVQAPLVFASEEWNVLPGPLTADQQLLNVTATPAHEEQSLFLTLDLTGSYQLKNLATVLSAVSALKKQGFRISGKHLAGSLKQVKKTTGLAGRWQTLSHNPLVICDTGHNEDGLKEVMNSIHSLPFERLHLVIGMVKDKELSAILPLFPKNAAYYFCSPQIERALPVAELELAAYEQGLNGKSFPSVTSAFEAARKQAAANDLIFIGGSTFVVAEVL